MYELYAQDVLAIPTPADWEGSIHGCRSNWANMLIPNPGCLANNEVYFHEWLGIFWYRWFRK